MAQRKQTVTTKSVAALAGVSQSTVSRVLNPDHKTKMVSEATAERVREAARQLNYSPHPIARALKGKTNKMIALLVREISDPFFAELIDLISIEVRLHGYNIVLGSVRSDPIEAQELTRSFDQRQMDGVICLGDFHDDIPFLTSMIKTGRPVVALCRGKKPTPTPTINCDNSKGIYYLLDYLIELGHKRFAFLDSGWMGDIHSRSDAFQKYFKEKGLKLDRFVIQTDGNTFNAGYKAMESLLSFQYEPTAILCADDQIAIGAIRAARKAGLDIPKDVSITGFDDVEMASYIVPSLTTVRQPIQKMSQKCLEILFQQIVDKDSIIEETYTEFLPELVVRESSGKPPSLK